MWNKRDSVHANVLGSEHLFMHTSIAMSLNLGEKLHLEDGMEEPVENLWVEYLRRSNPMKVNAEGVSRRLKELSPKLFCQPEKMQFDILDVASKFDLQSLPR